MRRRGPSVVVDTAAIALVVIARQPVGVVIDPDGRRERGRLRWDRRMLAMKRVVVLNGRVRREGRKTEAQGKSHRREFHSVLH